jgi:hypothetical protein
VKRWALWNTVYQIEKGEKHYGNREIAVTCRAKSAVGSNMQKARNR